MGKNWLRKVVVSLSGSKNAVIQGGGNTDLRIRFSVKQWHAQSTNMACISISNPSSQTVAAFKNKEFQKVQLLAGYEDNCGLIFSGDIKQTIAANETAVDYVMHIYAADGQQGYQSANVSRTLAAGWTPKDKVQVAMDAFAPFGITLGTVSLDLSTPAYPRGRPFVGMARDLIRQVALSAGGIWSIQNGKVMITPKTLDTGSTANPVRLAADTGLISYPVQTEGGITFRSLINPALQPLAKVTLDPSKIVEAERDNNVYTGVGSEYNTALDQQKLAAGTYVIYAMDRFGDTRANDWYDECVSIGVGGTIGKAAADNGYYVPGYSPILGTQ